MTREKRPIWRHVGIGLILGVAASVVNLAAGILFARYISLDLWGVTLLSLAVANAVYSVYAEKGEKPRLHAFVAPVLATTLPFLVVQVPVIWLLLGHLRSLYFDLAVITLIVFGAWMYITVEGMETRLRRKRRTQAPEGEIRYSPLYAVIAAMDILFFGVILVGSNTVWKNETVSWMTNLGFSVFVLLGVIILIAYLFERHYVFEEGVWYRPPFGLGPRRFMAWSDVIAVDYSPWAQWFVLQSYTGAKARIPLNAVNTDRFVRLLRTHVPSSVISDRAIRETKILTGKSEGR